MTLRPKQNERQTNHKASSGRRVAARPGAAGAGNRQHRRNRPPSPLARLVNQWWNRLIGAIYEGSLSEQEAEYESGSTGRDYIWNTVGTSIWGMVFPLLTIVCTQLVGAEQAGMFSMAFVAGTLLMILSNLPGIRHRRGHLVFLLSAQPLAHLASGAPRWYRLLHAARLRRGDVHALYGHLCI